MKFSVIDLHYLEVYFFVYIYFICERYKRKIGNDDNDLASWDKFNSFREKSCFLKKKDYNINFSTNDRCKII